MKTISMSGKERRRWEVFCRVRAGEFSLVKAADLLGISGRQAKRIWARYRDDRNAGLVHRLRDRASNRQPPPFRKEQALELYRRQKSAGYGPTLAAECLDRDDGLCGPSSTLLGVRDQASAVESLPPIPMASPQDQPRRALATGTDGRNETDDRPKKCPQWCRRVPKLVPNGLHRPICGLHRAAPTRGTAGPCRLPLKSR